MATPLPLKLVRYLPRNACQRITISRQFSVHYSLPRPTVKENTRPTRNGSAKTSKRPLNTGPNPILSSIANSDSRLRISYTLAALTALGLGATAWGLFEFFAMLTMWPEEVRGDLRAGLRAKSRGDIKLSQKHLMRAWQTVRTLPTSKLEPEPYLKITGVAVLLAEVFEEDGRLGEAHATLATALGLLTPRFTSLGALDDSVEGTSTSQSPKSTVPASKDVLKIIAAASNSAPSKSPSESTSSALPLSQKEDASQYSVKASPAIRKRAVALALKLGDLSETLQRPPAEEEALLSFAAEEVMRLVFQGDAFPTAIGTEAERSGQEEGKRKAQASNEKDNSASDMELSLPSWATITRTEVAAPLERLAAFYARQGKDGFALALYNGAVNLLLPSSSSGRSSSIPESCQALQILTAQLALLAELHTMHPDDPYPARSFMEATQRALAIYGEAYKRSGGNAEGSQSNDMSLCEDVYPAILYNAAVFHEGRGELDVALQFYARSVPRLQKGGSSDQVYEAQAGLRRVKRELEKRQSKRT